MPERAHRVFTDPYIRNLKAKAAPYKRAEYAPKGDGRLIVRVLPNGVREFFYRYRADEQHKMLALGRYDQIGSRPRLDARGRAQPALRRGMERLRGGRCKEYFPARKACAQAHFYFPRFIITRRARPADVA